MYYICRYVRTHTHSYVDMYFICIFVCIYYLPSMYSFSIYLSIYQSSSNLLIALPIHLILEYMAELVLL